MKYELSEVEKHFLESVKETQKQLEIKYLKNMKNAFTNNWTKLVYQQTGNLQMKTKVKFFVWHTMGDGKVCPECDSMEGKIFEHIDFSS